jgi:hypothetical protein
MGIAVYLRLPVMVCVNSLPNGTAIGARAPGFAWASNLAMLADIAPLFGERFPG